MEPRLNDGEHRRLRGAVPGEPAAAMEPRLNDGEW